MGVWKWTTGSRTAKDNRVKTIKALIYELAGQDRTSRRQELGLLLQLLLSVVPD